MYLTRIFCAIALGFLAFPLYSQTWSDTYVESKKSYEAGDLNAALESANQSLILYSNNPDGKIDNHAAILRHLQSIYFGLSQFEKGLETARKEVEIRTVTKNNYYADAVGQVGSFEQALGNYEKALAAYKEQLDILHQFYAASDPVVLQCRIALGICSYLSGDVKSAEIILSESIAQLPANAEIADYYQAYFFLGMIQKARGDNFKAVQSLTIVRKFLESQDLTASQDYGEVLFTIGKCAYDMRLFREAEDFFERAQMVYQPIEESKDIFYDVIFWRVANLKNAGAIDRASSVLNSVNVASLSGLSAVRILSAKALIDQSEGRSQQAAQHYKLALKQINGEDPQFHLVYGETLQSLAGVLAQQSKYDSAISTMEQSRQYFNESGVAQTKSVINLGLLYVEASRLDDALTIFKNIISNASVDPSSPEAIVARNGIGSVYLKWGNLRRADSVFYSILADYRSGKIQKEGNFPIVLNNYAAVLQADGNVNSAYDLMLEASNYTRQSGGAMSVAYASALENLATLNLNRGSTTRAKSQIDSALMIYQKAFGTESLRYASAQITLGQYHQSMGEYPQAEPCFKKSFYVFQKNQALAPMSFINSANTLANFYLTMGNYDEAEPIFKDLIKTMEKAGNVNSAEYSTTLQNLATLYQIQGKYDQAGSLLEKTLVIDEKVFGSSHPLFAIALKNLAAVYQKQGNLDNAQLLLENALQVTEKVYGKDHPSYALTISNLAALYQDQSKFAEAEKYWKESVFLRQRLLGENHPDYARSMYGLANNFFAQGKLDDAKYYFQTVMGQYLKQVKENFPSLSEKEKGAFYLKIKPVFESYQDFCIQYAVANKGKAEASAITQELYKIQLSTKAILLNSTAKVRQQIMTSNDQALIDSYKRWLDLKEKIGRYFTLTAEERKGHEDIGSLQVLSNDLEKELSSRSTVFRSQFVSQEFTPGQVASQLKEGEAAIEILRIRRKFKQDSVYYAGLILKPSDSIPQLVIWPYGAKLENRFYKYHRNAIKYKLADTVSYARFWRPIEKNIGNSTRVFISSDGIFNKVNLNGLQHPVRKNWVVDNYKIILLSNTKEVVERAQAVDNASAGDIHLYGYVDFNLKMDEEHKIATHKNALTRNFGFDGDIPLLPGTDKEVNDIYSILQSSPSTKVVLHKRNEATEESVKIVSNPKVLHVATHGFFMNDVDLFDGDNAEAEKFLNNPLLRSGLLLAGAGVKADDLDATTVEDGILTAYEAMNLTLDNTDLVVMSACETGLGEVRNGEGVYGLQRSFLVAGANAVMMSLWQVDDTATQELMVSFYQHWMTGDSKLDAFRKAQLSLKEKYDSPFYWGAFIMIGY